MTHNNLTDDQGTRQLVTETVSVEKAYRHTMNNKRSEDRMHCKYGNANYISIKHVRMSVSMTHDWHDERNRRVSRYRRSMWWRETNEVKSSGTLYSPFVLTNEDLELAERNQTDCTLGLAVANDIDKRNTILRGIAQIELNLSTKWQKIIDNPKTWNHEILLWNLKANDRLQSERIHDVGIIEEHTKTTLTVNIEENFKWRKAHEIMNGE